MEELTAFIQRLQSPVRAEAILKTLLLVTDDVLNNPSEAGRRISCDELSGVGIKFFKSYGFQEVTEQDLLELPATSNLEMLRAAQQELQGLLDGLGKSSSIAPTPVLTRPPAASPALSVAAPAKAAAAALAQPTRINGPVAAAPGAAAALQMAAAKISDSIAMSTVQAGLASHQNRGVDDTDTLGAAKVTPKREEAKDPNAPRHQVVPASVQSVAASVREQLSGLSVSSAPIANAKRGNTNRQAGGSSIWIAAPNGTTPESRICADLPREQFTYIERPWSHFVTRWAAIDWELERAMGDTPFSCVDLGSCHGFFSLQAAVGYPNSLVIGIEGSVGVGNGTTGVGGTEDEIIATKAVQTHVHWAERLKLSNCLLAPEVWDYRRVVALAGLGRPICDVLLSLSVIHHIDGVSSEQYKAENLSNVEGTVRLMARILELAPRHFIELPDAPWIQHVWNAFSSPREFLEAAARASNRQWSFNGPLVVSEWYGRREVWMMSETPCRNSVPWPGLKAIFPRVLGVSGAANSRLTDSALGDAGKATLSSVKGVSQSAASRAVRPVATRSLPASTGRAPLAQVTEAPSLAAGQPGSVLQEQLGAMLLSAPTALIAAHVHLRDALASAEGMLKEADLVK